MTVAQWQIYLKTLKRKMDEEAYSNVFGIDLVRGAPLETCKVPNRPHFQVFGKEDFLRNIFQRILKMDVRHNSSVIFIATAKADGLLEEANQILASGNQEKPQDLFLYSRRLPEFSINSLKDAKLFDKDDPKHLYVEFDEAGACYGSDLLSKLGEEIEVRFTENPLYYYSSHNPFIYLFRPENLLEKYPVINWVKKLDGHVSFRVFSGYVQLFNRNEASLLYGPELYPIKTCEKMRDYSYKAFERKRQWIRENEYFGDTQNKDALKAARTLVKELDIRQTAFGRFKLCDTDGYDHYWFYPVRQSMGSKPYRPPQKRSGNVTEAVKPPSLDYSPDVADIIEALKIKNNE